MGFRFSRKIERVSRYTLARECSGAVPAVAGATLRVCQPWLMVCRVGVALLRSAPGQGVSRPPHAASRDCRTAHPLPVRTRVRLHRNTGSRISVPAPTRSAASRAGMAGWAGEGGGRFGERREYEAPTLPRTPRQHGMARHYKNQARNSTLQPHGAARHHTSPQRQPRNTCPLKHANCWGNGPVTALTWGAW